MIGWGYDSKIATGLFRLRPNGKNVMVSGLWRAAQGGTDPLGLLRG
jgi:hypothetical protein